MSAAQVGIAKTNMRLLDKIRAGRERLADQYLRAYAGSGKVDTLGPSR